MNELNNVAEAKNPETGNRSDSPELALLVDTQIMRLLGLKFEIVDDTIKVWPRDVVPDETNWLVGGRFSSSLEESMNLLEGLKVEVEFFESSGYHWAVVHFGEDGELETEEARSKEMAGAFAAYTALWGRRGNKS